MRLGEGGQTQQQTLTEGAAAEAIFVAAGRANYSKIDSSTRTDALHKSCSGDLLVSQLKNVDYRPRCWSRRSETNGSVPRSPGPPEGAHLFG